MGRERVLALAVRASIMLASGHALAEPTQRKGSLAPLKPPPLAARGFRCAFELGTRAPLGRATREPGDTLAARYSPQLAIAVDLGWQFAQSLFVGAYAGFNEGVRGSGRRSCARDANGSCQSFGGDAGIEVQYSLAPSASYNPWLGYGFGYELGALESNDSSAGHTEHVTSTGVTYARLSAGLDLRSRVGYGPFVAAALGQFTSTTTELDGRGEFTSRIHDRAFHVWVTIGLRLVFNP
jgi:hypothetical protein